MTLKPRITYESLFESYSLYTGDSNPFSFFRMKPSPVYTLLCWPGTDTGHCLLIPSRAPRNSRRIGYALAPWSQFMGCLGPAYDGVMEKNCNSLSCSKRALQVSMTFCDRMLELSWKTFYK